MFGWLQSIAHAVASVVIGSLAFLGLGGSSLEKIAPTPVTPTKEASITASTTDEQIQALQGDLESERNARLELEKRLRPSIHKIVTTTNTDAIDEVKK